MRCVKWTGEMLIRSYVVRFDGGFAPNPFGGYLTLATCKPRIRKHAQVGDLVVGTGSTQSVGADRLVYAGIVSQVLSIEEYGALEEFKDKQPFINKKSWSQFGDNIYAKNHGKWTQRANRFHPPEAQDHDLSGENALICERFWYYGRKAIRIPARFHRVIKSGPGHKIIRDERFVSRFLDWLHRRPEGRHGYPYLAPTPNSEPGC